MRKLQKGFAKRVRQLAKRRQRDVLSDVLLSATECEAWLTLDELTKLTQYPPASISAQLRHLRKPENGGYLVEKRPRFSQRALRGEDFGTEWEYQMKRPEPKKSRGVKRVAIAKQPELQAAAC